MRLLAAAVAVAAAGVAAPAVSVVAAAAAVVAAAAAVTAAVRNPGLTPSVEQNDKAFANVAARKEAEKRAQTKPKDVPGAGAAPRATMG